MAKSRNNAIMQEVKKVLPKRAFAIIKWWHQQYDEVWAIASHQYPTEEWVNALIFQQFVLMSSNGISNNSLGWGIASIAILDEEQFYNLSLKDFDLLLNGIEVTSETQRHIALHGFEK